MNIKRLSVLQILVFLFSGLTITGYGQKEYAAWPSGNRPEDPDSVIAVMTRDDKSGISYLVSNDREKLYIDILLDDPGAIQRTMRFGFTTWLDPAGKKKKRTGIQFPVEGAPAQPHNAQKTHNREKMMAEARQFKASRMKLIGFSGKDSEEIVNPMTDPQYSGKLTHLGREKLMISLALPLEALGGYDLLTAGTFSIGFETGYLDLNRSGMGASAGGGSRMGPGGFHGGGGPPGGGPPDQDFSGRDGQPQRVDLKTLATPSKMWLKNVKLHKDS